MRDTGGPTSVPAGEAVLGRLVTLRRRENALREKAITMELLDVATGSEAILGSSDR
ncbi:hypothetical protein AAFN88_11905 [Pelagibius sp. CAU 1746]|uniref:hypothetical protein n=1 Tax=Pelagibius sp. CAU 1746 TaxID=3140370 RepID=UPI00325C2CF6